MSKTSEKDPARKLFIRFLILMIGAIIMFIGWWAGYARKDLALAGSVYTSIGLGIVLKEVGQMRKPRKK